MLTEVQPQVRVPMGVTLGRGWDSRNRPDDVCLQRRAAGQHVLVPICGYDSGEVAGNKIQTHTLQFLQQTV